MLAAITVYVIMAYLVPGVTGDSILANGLTQASVILALYGLLLFLFPALISLFNSWRKRRRLDTQQDIDSSLDLSWQSFEELAGEVFRRQGYRVVENDSTGPDGGVDLVISKEDKHYLVQCKQWRTRKVGVKVVREMLGLVTAEHAAGGVVITSGQFTHEAVGFAKEKDLELVDGEKLAVLISEVQKEPKISPSSEVGDGTNIESVPACPVCSSEMVLRTARKGKNAGQQFWGCSGFPQCRGTKVFKG